MWRKIAVTLTAGAVLAGCANANSGAARTTADKAEVYKTRVIDTKASGQPVAGGTLTLAGGGEPTVLDPTVTPAHAAVGGIELAAIYDTLMRYDVESHEFVPQLAESLTPNADATTFTLALRDGVTFSDGTPLDAAAVVASFKRYVAAPAALDSALLSARVKGVRAVDDHTVEFSLNKPWGNFASMLAVGPGMVVAPSAYAKKAFRPIGAGPFVFDHHAPNEELVLTSRKDYWDGAPPLAKVRVVWLGGDDARADAFRNGDVNSAYVSNARVIEDLVKAGTHGYLDVQGMSAGYVLGINQRAGRPGADPTIRKAIQLAIDPKTYMQRAVGGAGLATGEMFPENSPWNPGLAAPKPNPEEAKKLVAAAKAKGFEGKLVLNTPSEPVARAGGLAIKAMLEAVGFSVKHEMEDDPTAITKKVMIDHDYDIATTGLPISDDDPASRLYSGLNSKSVFNTSGVNSPELDRLIDQLLEVSGPEEGKPIVAKIEKVFWREVPVVVLSAGANFIPWSDDVHGMVPTKNMIVLLGHAWVG